MDRLRNNTARRLFFESLEEREFLAAPEPLSEGRIVWHSYTDYSVLDGHIHVYDFDDGSYYMRATNTIADSVTHAHNPNLSSDGRYMTFMGLPKGPAYGTNWRNYLDVFVYDFVTDHVVNLSAKLGLSDPGEIEEDPVLSANGDKVAFKRNVANIWEADVYTLNVRQLTSGSGERSGPQYSPDGSELIFWINSGANSLLGKISLQGTHPIAPVALHNNPGIQDYFPSYWDSNRVLYTSWRNSSERDDDVKIWNIANQADTFAAFNSTQAEDSDPFGITTALVGFSTTRASLKWQIWYGDPVTGDIASLGISQAGRHNLGAEYTLQKVVYQPPSADFDVDGDIDGRDFLAWQRGFGIEAPNAIRSDGDADHNLTVDAVDLAFWQSQYTEELAGIICERPLVDMAQIWIFHRLTYQDTAAESHDSKFVMTETSEIATFETTEHAACKIEISNRAEVTELQRDFAEDSGDPLNNFDEYFTKLGEGLFAW